MLARTCYVWSAPWKKFCSCVLRSLLITYLRTSSLEKEIIVLGKGLEKVLNFGSKNLCEPWMTFLTQTRDSPPPAPAPQYPYDSVTVLSMMLFVYSVHLARRVLQLERANTSLRDDMEREKKKKDLLGKEVMTTNTRTDWRLLLDWVCKGNLQMQFLAPERSNSWKINMSVLAGYREIEFKARISVKKYCMPEK